MKCRNVILGIVASMLLVSCNTETSNNSSKDNETDKLLHKYTITWKNYDGTILETDKDVEEGTLPTYDGATPSRPDDGTYSYSFTGWSPEVVIASKDQTYTATYSSKKITYTIEFDLNGGTSASYNGSQVVETFTKDVFFFDCVKEGLNFRGWSYNGVKIFDEKGNQLANPAMASTMRFVAQYANTAKLTITTNMAGAGKITGEGEYNYNTNVSISVEVNQGYTFLGWCYEDGTLLSKQLSYSFKMWNQDVTIVAKFDYESYTLSVETYNKTLGLVMIKGVGGTFIENQESKIKYKSSVTIAAYTATETPFLGWFNEDGILIETNAVYEFVMPYNDYKLVARWNLFRLDVTSIDETLGTVNDASGNYTNGEKVDLVATPNEGSEFVGWYLDDELLSSSQTFKFEMPSSNASVVAKFKLKSFNVNVFTSETTKGTVSGSGSYEYGSEVTLTATPNGTNQFKGWYIDDELISKDNPYIFNIGSADLLIEGKFAGTLYTIKFVTNGGDPIDDLVAEYGDEISIKPNKTGYTFVGWYTDSALSLTSYYELGDTMPAFNGTLYAKWSIVNYTISYHLDIRTTNNSSNPSTYNILTETITLLDPTVIHGTFDGWYTDEEYNNPISQIVKGSIGNLDLYAKVTANIYTITFVTNGGDAISSISGLYGDAVKLPSATKANSVFVGWFTDSALETKANIKTIPGENITLYAKWTEMYQVFEMDSKQYMYFGSYPQSVVSDSDLVNELDNLTTTNSKGYYEYNGNEYAKKRVSAYDSSYTYEDGSSIGSGTTKYFKVEPILWRVLTSDSSGNYTLLADQVINAHKYNEYYSGQQDGYYANNYGNSEIRTWINNEFYNTAFKTAEKGAILTTNVDNSASSTDSTSNQYACDNTSDKVYLLSYKDYLNADYGFSSSSYSSSTRTCKPSDYALANYCSMDTSTRNCYYWTRSPYSFYSYGAWCVGYDGSLYGSYVSSSDRGVRPALTINL